MKLCWKKSRLPMDDHVEGDLVIRNGYPEYGVVTMY
jgi:hypothetical protein